VGIEDILRKNDAKRAAQGNAVRNAADRALHARAGLVETVARELVAALHKIHDQALGEVTRLPIASKPMETGIYFECEGIVRFTLHCVVRTDPNGVAYCSPIDLSMSRHGKIARGSFEPVMSRGGQPHRLGVPEKYFAIEAPRLQQAIETLASQL
jgi:hypothetical protein